MMKDGPLPIENSGPAEEGRPPAGIAAGSIDHEHYVQKQIRPIAEPVLAIAGLDFDRVVGDERQLGLF
jgi:DNA polymerase-2